MADPVAPFGVSGVVRQQMGLPPSPVPAAASASPSASPSPAPLASGPWENYQPAAVASSTPAAAPVTAAPQAAADGPWADYAQQQPAGGRDALGGYILPPQPPDPAQAQQSTSFLGKVGHAVDSGVRSVEQGATFGFGDEINAGEQAVEQPLFGNGSNAATLGQRYAENLAAERARMAEIPAAVSIPGQIVGGGATIAADAPVAVARYAAPVVRAIPGGANLLAGLGAVGDTVGNALSQIPGVARYVAPVAKSAAIGAGYGGLQGFGDGEGGFDSRLQSAELGAATGAVLGPVVEGAGNLAGKGYAAVRNAISEAGYGTKAPILDAAGKSIIRTDGQPVAATPGVARVAGQQIADTTTDVPAAQAALANQPAPLLPGDQPTMFQVTGDYGQGQKELELRNKPGVGNTPGSSGAFLKRAADQNAVRVSAVTGSVPDTASSADLVNGLDAQRTTLAAQQDAAAATARGGTLQGVGGATDSAPTQAGSDLRGAIDQARAPALQVADAAVQRGQAQAAGSLDAIGGVPAGDAATAQQSYGQAFRAPLVAGDAAAKANVTRLANAIDPDSNLATDMTPIRAKANEIVQGISPNAAPPTGEEAAILQTAQNLPDV